MTRRIGISAIGAVAAALFTGASSAGASGEPRIVTGIVSYVSAGALSVGGQRLLITPKSTAFSDGRTVSPSSIRPGSMVEAEMDDAGRLIHLETKGVVE